MEVTHIFYCCIGTTDRKAAKAAFQNNDLGPIARALLREEPQTYYAKAVLLSDEKIEHHVDQREDELYLKRLNDLFRQTYPDQAMTIELVWHQASAMDRSALYEVMRKAVEQHSLADSHRTYLLSAGTPAMHLCWTLLGHSERYRARLIDASEKEGVKEVPHWVELAHAFIPTIPTDLGQFLVAMGRELVIPNIIGSDSGIERAKGLAALAARSKRDDYPVLIFGETGTGKESIARLIHKGGKAPAPEEKFMAINCGAVSESLLESELFGYVKGAFTGAVADRKGLLEEAGAGGTLFLDEIGEMPLTMQVKFLRVLQEKKVRPVGSGQEKPIDNIRIVAATHRSLAEGVSEGWFRADLYYRLNVIQISLPPLRDRPGDLPSLTKYFIDSINQDLKECGLKPVVFKDDAMQPLMKHSWPGNIRELQNTLRRAAIFANKPDQTETVIDAALLREVILPPVTSKPDWKNIPLWQLDLNKLLAEVKQHYYQRFHSEEPDLSRKSLADRMGMSLPTLKKVEDEWAKQGQKIGPRQTRSRPKKS